MSYEIVRSLSFTKKGAKVSLASSNVVPKHFETITIEPREGETLEDIKKSIFLYLKGGSYQIQPSVKTNVHLAYLLSEIAKEYLLFDYFKISRDLRVSRNFLLEDLVFANESGLEFEELDIPTNYDVFYHVFKRDDLKNDKGEVRSLGYDFLYPMDMLKGTRGSDLMLMKIFIANYIQREVFLIYSQGGFNEEVEEDCFMKYGGSFADIGFSKRFRYGANPKSLKENLFILNKHHFNRDMKISDKDGNDFSLEDILRKSIDLDGLIDKYAKPVLEENDYPLYVKDEDIEKLQTLIDNRELDALHREVIYLLDEIPF